MDREKRDSEKDRDYTRKCFTMTITVIVLLVGVAFIPGFRLWGITFKRANILSDVIEFHDRELLMAEQLIDTSFYEDVPEGLLAMLDRRVSEGEGDGYGISNTSAPKAAERKYYVVPNVQNESLTPIEDYSEGQQMTAKFYYALAKESSERVVRVAVFGDSFIEADIITVDIREQLQTRYGGGGAGFVPMSSPLAKYRSSVKHTFSGWETYNIINKKSVPEEYKGRFAVSGMVSVPYEGATVRYEGSNFRDHLAKFSSAYILFKNRASTIISLGVNGGAMTEYKPETSDELQCVSVDGSIKRVDMKLAGTAGFIGYGVILEDDKGVNVHNFSVRSNSGTALIGTDPELNRQLNDLMRYDLIIIQYGLNAMSVDVLNYESYRKQLVRIIEYVKICFPQSAIIVMSVGDRSTLKDGQRVTMPAALAMLKCQRAAAQEAGVAFWNTFQAMGGENSMVNFVQKGWAAKDYTHIGFPGGKYIATQFVDYVKAATDSVCEIYDSGLFDNSIPLPSSSLVPEYDDYGELDEIMRRNEVAHAGGDESVTDEDADSEDIEGYSEPDSCDVEDGGIVIGLNATDSLTDTPQTDMIKVESPTEIKSMSNEDAMRSLEDSGIIAADSIAEQTQNK